MSDTETRAESVTFPRTLYFHDFGLKLGQRQAQRTKISNRSLPAGVHSEGPLPALDANLDDQCAALGREFQGEGIVLLRVRWNRADKEQQAQPSGLHTRLHRTEPNLPKHARGSRSSQL